MTTPTRSPRRTFTWRLAAAVTGVAVLATGLGACSTNGSAPDSASSSASDAITEAADVDVDVKEAGIETDIAEFLGKSLVSGIVGAGGAKGFNSALAAIFGDPTTEALDTITSQLDAVTTQVAALQQDVTQLQTTVDTNYYNDVARNLEQQINAINELQIQGLQGIVDDAKALQAVKGTPGEATARTNLDNSKASFVRIYEDSFAAYSAIAPNIHEVLLPAGALTDKSILKARGQVLMNKGYVNSGDSDDLYRLQSTLAQEEALAVYLNAEYLVMSGKQTTADQLVTDWSNAQSQEIAALPPRIPTGTIISTASDSTTNAPMFAPDINTAQLNADGFGRGLFNVPIDARNNPLTVRDEDGVAYTSVEQATRMAMADPAYEGLQYGIPTVAELQQLVAATSNAPGSTAAERIGNAGAVLPSNHDFDIGDPRGAWRDYRRNVNEGAWIWTSDTWPLTLGCGFAIQSPTLVTYQQVTYQVPVAVSLAPVLPISAFIRPAIAPWNDPDASACTPDLTKAVKEQDINAQADLIFHRTTTGTEDYMAQG